MSCDDININNCGVLNQINSTSSAKCRKCSVLVFRTDRSLDIRVSTLCQTALPWSMRVTVPKIPRSLCKTHVWPPRGLWGQSPETDHAALKSHLLTFIGSLKPSTLLSRVRIESVEVPRPLRKPTLGLSCSGDLAPLDHFMPFDGSPRLRRLAPARTAVALLLRSR